MIVTRLSPRKHAAALTVALSLALPCAANADDGRLLATGGATQIEGSAGGGIVPWAVLSGYGTAGQHGGTAFATRVDTGDYALTSYGAAYAWDNRLELSYARQRFELGEFVIHGVDGSERPIRGQSVRQAPSCGMGEAPALSFGFASGLPNPLTPGAQSLRFSLSEQGQVSLAVFDPAGRRLRKLHDGPLAAGQHAVTWDGRDDAGRTLPAGVYLCRLEQGSRSQVRKLVMVK